MRKFQKHLIVTAAAAAMVAALGTAVADQANAGPFADPNIGIANPQGRVGAPDHENNDPGAMTNADRAAMDARNAVTVTETTTTTSSTDTTSAPDNSNSASTAVVPAPDTSATAPTDSNMPSSDNNAAPADPTPAPRADRN